MLMVILWRVNFYIIKYTEGLMDDIENVDVEVYIKETKYMLLSLCQDEGKIVS
jgi:hypothetical protein